MNLRDNPREFFLWQETADGETLFDFIYKWHCDGETSDELIKFIEFFREKSTALKLSPYQCFDCAGTGGDKTNSFNISTATAFLAAYHGLALIKNGGRSASSKVGSVDVLMELGLDLSISEEEKLNIFKKCGLSFLSSEISAVYLAKVKNAARKHKESCFINLIAPFLSRVELNAQLIGIAQSRWVPVIREIAKHFLKQGYREQFILVHAEVHPEKQSLEAEKSRFHAGLDEFNSICDSRIIFLKKLGEEIYEKEFSVKISDVGRLAERISSRLRRRTENTISLKEFNLTKGDIKDLEGSNSKDNAEIICKIFQGEAFKNEQAPLRIKAETLILNTALCLCLSKDLSSFTESSLLKELQQNFIKLKESLSNDEVYKFLSEIRKYFTKSKI